MKEFARFSQVGKMRPMICRWFVTDSVTGKTRIIPWRDSYLQHSVESNTCGWHQQPEINSEVSHSTSSGCILQRNGSGPSLCPLLQEDTGPLFLTVFEQGIFSSSFVQYFVKAVTSGYCNIHDFSLLTVLLAFASLFSFLLSEDNVR